MNIRIIRQRIGHSKPLTTTQDNPIGNGSTLKSRSPPRDNPVDYVIVAVVAFIVGLPLTLASVAIWPPERKSILDIPEESDNIDITNRK